MEPFISRMREDHPNVVFVLYTDKDCLERFCNRHPRFRNYFHLPEIIIPGTFGYRPKKTAPEVFSLEPAVDAILRRCEEWHHTRYEYDVCLSFAGEDRQVAQKLANRLTRYGHRVFYDRYEEAELIGKNLYTHLHEVYSAKSRYCVILVSAAYANKIWTSHERTAAQDRALNERGREYVIPIRLDNTPIQGLPSTIGYAKIDKGIKYISDLIDQKLVLREARKKGHLGRALY
jgi:hypothetical protein